jgi:hypothetical protein
MEERSIIDEARKKGISGPDTSQRIPPKYEPAEWDKPVRIVTVPKAVALLSLAVSSLIAVPKETSAREKRAM